MNDKDKELMNGARDRLLAEERRLRAFKDDLRVREQAVGEDHPEMLAQVTLAFRHLEDARMRLGKVIQYGEGGVSINDSPERLRDRADDLDPQGEPQPGADPGPTGDAE